MRNRLVASVLVVAVILTGCASSESETSPTLTPTPTTVKRETTTTQKVGSTTVVKAPDTTTKKKTATTKKPKTTTTKAPTTTKTPTTVAPTSVTEARSDSPEPVDRGAKALGQLGMDRQIPVPGWRVLWLPRNPGYRGRTDRSSRTIEIFVGESVSDKQIQHTIAHETGHTIDIDRLTDENRELWGRKRAPGQNLRWSAPVNGNDREALAGDFAETCAWLAAGGLEWNSEVAGIPSPSDISLFNKITASACARK